MPIVKQASAIVEFAERVPLKTRTTATHYPLRPADTAICQVATLITRGLPLAMKNFWLVKQEPSSYSWSDFIKEGQTSWTGVRNYAARNNLRRMQKGDEILFYHSGEDKAVVGIAKVIRTAYRDSTAKEEDWSTVDLAPVQPLRRPVTLGEIKNHWPLKDIQLVRQSRLSVMPLEEAEFREIVKMSAG